MLSAVKVGGNIYFRIMVITLLDLDNIIMIRPIIAAL